MFFTEKISEFVESKVLKITTGSRIQVSGKSTGRMAKGHAHKNISEKETMIINI